VSAQQLELPWPDPYAQKPLPISPKRRIYVNRDLKLSRCDWIGFDMDYTLAIYRQDQMDRLSVRATIEKLVARGYPEWILTLEYPLTFPIRGLLIDKHMGNVLKMNRFKIVRKGYHGLRELTRNELRALYYEKKIRHKSSRYHWIDTLYSLSEACMYAAIIDAYEARGSEVRYGKLFNDIRECIDEAHRDGTVADAVTADLLRYVEKDLELAPTLHKLRSAGKKLFLLTNSRWPYTKAIMSHLLDGALPDYPSFQHYFDAIIVAAKKPDFFQQKNPLLERVDAQTTRPAVLPLERGKVYEGGNLDDLQEALGVTGNRVVYVGDHIYGDMLRSKKDSTWRTAMILQELEDEIRAHVECKDDATAMSDLHHRRAELEDSLRHFQARAKHLMKPNGNGNGNGNGTGNGNGNPELSQLKRLIGAIRRQLRNVDRDARVLRRQIDERFHPFWGPILKEAGELSLFGAQVNEYACVYLSRVSNMLAYSPYQYFRSPHNAMHHEV
jgi:5'-nucleotidase